MLVLRLILYLESRPHACLLLTTPVMNGTGAFCGRCCFARHAKSASTLADKGLLYLQFCGIFSACKSCASFCTCTLVRVPPFCSIHETVRHCGNTFLTFLPRKSATDLTTPARLYLHCCGVVFVRKCCGSFRAWTLVLMPVLCSHRQTCVAQTHLAKAVPRGGNLQ